MDIYAFTEAIADNDDAQRQQSRSEALTSSRMELDEEMRQLKQGLSSLWGGFRKQSQAALEYAQKQAAAAQNQAGPQVEALVGRAKAEMERLNRKQEEIAQVSRSAEAGPTASDAETDVPSASETTGVDVATGSVAAESSAPGRSDSTASQTTSFFARISNQLSSNANVQQLQRTLSSSLATLTTTEGSGDEKERPKPQQLLATIAANIQSHIPHLDVQESRHLAEQYLHVSEEWVKARGEEIDALWKEHGEQGFFRLVPPEEHTGRQPAARDDGGESEKGKEKEVLFDALDKSEQEAPDDYRATSTPTESCPDPSQVSVAASDRASAAATEAEARRKQILEASQKHSFDDDFDWSDDDGEGASVAPTAEPAKPAARPGRHPRNFSISKPPPPALEDSPPSRPVDLAASTSPSKTLADASAGAGVTSPSASSRNSSESYDVVGARSGDASRTGSAGQASDKEKEKERMALKEATAEVEEEDSDWE